MRIRNIGPSLVHKWTYITDVVQTLIQGSRVLWDHFFTHNSPPLQSMRSH